MSAKKLPALATEAYTRYLGCLGLLAECSVYVPEELREQIMLAFEHACMDDGDLRWRRIMNRVDIEVGQ